MILSGCGGDEEQTTVSNANEPRARPSAPAGSSKAALDDPVSAATRRALLRGSDFPSDWSAKDSPIPAPPCMADSPYRRATVSVTSQLFKAGQTTVQQVVWVFPDAGAARRAYGSSALRDTRACLRRIVTEQLQRHSGRDIGGTKVVEEDAGARTRSVRLKTELHSPVQTPFGPMDAMVEVVTDVDVSRVKRAISLVVAVSPMRALDGHAEIAHLAERRLGRAIAGWEA